MRTDNILKVSVFALLMASSASAAAMAQDDLTLSLGAVVPTRCVVANVEPLPSASGSQLRVETACNANSFMLTLDGVPNLDVSAVRPFQNAGQTPSVSPAGIEVSPDRPGVQIIEIDFTNDPADLASLAIGVEAS
ncbi:hypothetical protein D1227_08545 [Henriciella mobilis]|nr:hypothetical protein D1231_05025 [Henriciella mobilis]RIJ22443.1 hypothetical protein D1227_08545 [Henriciella mobilis]